MRTISLRQQQEAFALSHPTRKGILKLLKKELCVFHLQKKLGIRSSTTVRHHVDILLKAKLIKKTRTVEIRGGNTKYYKAQVLLKEVK
jgi:DNA-binding transcriptional ArsR family regulator